ncbi:MAG: D-glucuronyl C5-epimerase family protein, partial [Conexibacter sp.]
PPARTFRRELKRMLTAGRIDGTLHDRCRRAFDEAIRTASRLTGARRLELQGVVDNAHDIAARGGLAPERLPAICLTLERNRQWWTSGSLLASGQRVEFDGSQLVWEHYPGEGIELQVLGTFGKANGLWMAGDDVALRALLDEMVGLAARRGRAWAWEYYFDFGGGRPPWTSAMSQATGIQALARAGQRLGEPVYLEVAKRALPLFQLPPPLGVRQATDAGARYLIYSYAPGLHVVNAFVQTLVGLFDYGAITRSAAAGKLFRAGDRQARSDVAGADTGAWSLYALGGAESDLGYHVLLRDFLRNLCDRTTTPIYCDTAVRFTRDLREPPELTLLTTRVRARQRVLVRFELSKISRVGMTIRREGETVLATSATVSRGPHAYAWDVPPMRGIYDVVLSATDLAGNTKRTDGEIEVLRRKPSPAPRGGGARP